MRIAYFVIAMLLLTGVSTTAPREALAAPASVTTPKPPKVRIVRSSKNAKANTRKIQAILKKGDIAQLKAGQIYLINASLKITRDGTGIISSDRTQKAILKFEPTKAWVPTCQDYPLAGGCDANFVFVERIDPLEQSKLNEGTIIHAIWGNPDPPPNNVVVQGIEFQLGEKLSATEGAYVSAVYIRGGQGHRIEYNSIGGANKQRAYIMDFGSIRNSKITHNHIHDYACCSSADIDRVQITGIAFDDSSRHLGAFSDNRGRIAPRGAARAQVPRSAARRVPVRGWSA